MIARASKLLMTAQSANRPSVTGQSNLCTGESLSQSSSPAGRSNLSSLRAQKPQVRPVLQTLAGIQNPSLPSSGLLSDRIHDCRHGKFWPTTASGRKAAKFRPGFEGPSKVAAASLWRFYHSHLPEARELQKTLAASAETRAPTLEASPKHLSPYPEAWWPATPASSETSLSLPRSCQMSLHAARTLLRTA